MKKLLLIIPLILWGAIASAQGVRFGEGQPVQSVVTPNGPIFSVANASISFCNYPANAVPCTNKATTYTNIGIGTACPTSTQLTLMGSSACVGTTDQYGNWGVWVASGTYSFTITLPNGGSTGPYTVTLSGGGGSGTPTGPSYALQIANLGATAFATAIGLNGWPLGVDSTTSPTQLDVPFDEAVAGPRPWIDVTSPVYGAKGDGATDDTAAITAAINAACATKIGGLGAIPNVVFPAGNYLIDQTQGASTTPDLPACAGLKLKGLGSGALMQFGQPSQAYIQVVLGASPSPAPVFGPTNLGGGASMTFEDLGIDAYNQAVWANNAVGLQLSNTCLRVKTTGQADNTPLKLTDIFDVWMDKGCLETIAPGGSTTNGALPVSIWTGEVNGGASPNVYLIRMENVVLAGGPIQYIQRAASTSCSTDWKLIGILREASTTDFLDIMSTGPTVCGGDITIDHFQDADTSGNTANSVINDSAPGVLSGVTINHAAVADQSKSAGRAITMSGTSSLDHVFITGCETFCSTGVLNTGGAIIGPDVAQNTNGLDFISPSTDQMRLLNNLLENDTGPSARFVASGSPFGSMADDATLGILFGTGLGYGWTANVHQTAQETLDIGFSTMLPPTAVTATPAAGGTLPNGTYYYFVAPSTGAGSCVNTSSGAPSLISSAAVVTTGSNQVTVSWSLPPATPVTPTGYCVYRNTISSTLTQTGLYVSGAGTTTVTDTGSNFGIAGSGFEYNQMVARHRFTPNGLNLAGGVNAYTDTGVANAYVVTTSPTFTTLPLGFQVCFFTANGNTAASTINVDGIGATSIKKQGGTTALASGDISANSMPCVIFDGTLFELPGVANAPVAGVSSVSGDSGGIISNSGSTGAVTLAFATESAHTVLAGPASGSAAVPTFQTAPTIAVTNMTGTGAFNTSGNAGTASTLGACLEASAGDICYYTGSAWAVLTGNVSSTQYLQETSSGVPSWTVPAGAGTVTHSAGALTSGQPVIGNGSADVKVGPINLAGGSSFVTGVLPVTNLPNSGATTVNGQSCALNATCTIPVQTAGVGNASQNGTNYSPSTTNAVGLTVTPVNSSGIIEKFEVTGASYTGNAATATALASTPSLCSAGTFAQGILASGNATGCSAGSGTVNTAAQYATPYYSASGTANTLSGLAAPTTPGLWLYGYNVPSSSAVTPSVFLAGISPRDVTGTTATDTILAADSSNCVFYEGSVAVAVTLPTPTTLGNPHFVMCVANRTTGSTTAVTFTSSGGLTINGASTYVLNQGETGRFTVDAGGSWEADGGPPQLTAGTNITFGRSAYGLTINSTSGGTVNTGTTGHLAYYASSTTAVSDMGADFTFATHTLTAGSSAILNLNAVSPTAGFGLPIAAGAAPTADGFDAFNTTTHAQVWGSNGTTIVGAAAATGTGTATTCSNQFVTVISAIAIPTCTTVTPAYAAGNTSGSGNFVLVTSPTLITPALGAATATSLLASGIVDGKAPITITTGTTATLGAATYQSGYTFNQEATAATSVTYTLPATATGLQYCVANSIVSGTGAPTTGVLKVYPPASSYVILAGVINTIGGGGTHGVSSGGAAADAACFVAIDATHWNVYVQSGTWTAN